MENFFGQFLASEPFFSKEKAFAFSHRFIINEKMTIH